MEVTQSLVRELLHYNAIRGELKWKPRDRKWFKTEADWLRWNGRYAGKPAFTYIHSGKRWGCVLNQNFLAHRIVWLIVKGYWPKSIVFDNGDACDLRFTNLIERGQPTVPTHRVGLRQRVRLPLAA